MLGGHDQLGTEPCLLRKDAQGTLKDKGSGSSTKSSLRTCPLAFSGGTPSTPQPETGLLNGTSAKFKAVPTLAWRAAGRTDCLRDSRLPPYLEGSEGQSTPGLRPQGAATAWGGHGEVGETAASRRLRQDLTLLGTARLPASLMRTTCACAGQGALERGLDLASRQHHKPLESQGWML